MQVLALQSHSERLASIYSARANIHAKERYRLECLQWLGQCRMVLDIGCGTTDLLARLRAAFPVLGVDVTMQMMAAGPGRGYVAAAAAEQLPFADSSFDGALSINVLEHVPQPGRVLKELARILCIGGRAVLITPAAEWSMLLDLAERFQLKLPEGPHRFLGRAELLRMTMEANLEPLVHRRILTLPLGGKRLARAEQFVEQWTVWMGTLHLLVVERRV